MSRGRLHQLQRERDRIEREIDATRSSVSDSIIRTHRLQDELERVEEELERAEEELERAEEELERAEEELERAEEEVLSHRHRCPCGTVTTCRETKCALPGETIETLCAACRAEAERQVVTACIACGHEHAGRCTDRSPVPGSSLCGCPFPTPSRAMLARGA